MTARTETMAEWHRAVAGPKRAGRSRKGGPRHPNGQLVRQPREDVTKVVKEQPHRLGSLDQSCESAIGRLILAGKVGHKDIAPGDFKLAADEYLRTYANWRWVVESKRPFAKGGHGSGSGPTEAEAAVFKSAWEGLQRAIRLQAGERALKAADAAIGQQPGPDWTPSYWVVHYVTEALMAVIAHYGLTVRSRRGSS